jgi:hypothetical protein
MLAGVQNAQSKAAVTRLDDANANSHTGHHQGLLGTAAAGERSMQGYAPCCHEKTCSSGT